VRLGAFETAFLLGMTISVVVGGSGIAAWCLAHHKRDGGPIKTDSTEGRMVIAAVARGAEAATNPTTVESAPAKQP
jgi:hypothetical protein